MAGVHRLELGKAGDEPTSESARGHTAGLRRAAQARTTRAEKAADAAIRDLIKRGAIISFTAVARVVGVTPAFLHRHPELSARIRELCARQKETARDQHATTTTGEGTVFAALHRKLKDQETAHAAKEKKLRGRIKELETQVAALYGRLPRALSDACPRCPPCRCYRHDFEVSTRVDGGGIGCACTG